MLRALPAGPVISDPKVYYRKLGSHLYPIEKDFFTQTRIYPKETVATLNGLLILTKHGVLIERCGYVCDGPSGPTFDTKSSIRGGFVHDGGYRLMRRGLVSLDTRIIWDEHICEICIEDKMWVWRANSWYKMLRLWGKKNASPKNVRPILIAP